MKKKTVKTITITRDVMPVAERTLLRRVNRFLEAQAAEKKTVKLVLKKTRPGRSKDAKKGALSERQRAMGLYFLASHKAVLEKHVDLEKFARKLSLLEPYEVLE